MISILKPFLGNEAKYLIKNGTNVIINGQFTRFKKKDDTKNKRKLVSETESEEASSENFEDSIQDKSTKVMNVHVHSLRTDLLLKAGLGIARNKVETLFYESKIRLNGQKINKKSVQVEVGDEIDVIRGPNPNNPNFLTVARVEILSAKEKEDSISVKLRRSKSLTVENYDEKWKSD